MFALMPRPSSLFEARSQPPILRDQMSLTIHPPAAPSASNQQARHNAFPSMSSPSSKRPKLSLNTINVPSGSTSLRLETLSATSPTTINTFQNRQKVKSSSVDVNPKRPTLTPLFTDVDRPSRHQLTPWQTPLPISADAIEESTLPVLSAASAIAPADDFSQGGMPYTLPFDAISILTNGPIPRSQSSPPATTAPSDSSFPPSKKVGFRAPLTEDIQNFKFTLSHADIVESPLRLSAGQPPSTDASGMEGADTVTMTESSTTQSGSKRDSFDLEEKEESCVATPVAGRAKRQRWVWTIEPPTSGVGSKAEDQS